MASAHGDHAGKELPFDLVMANVERIVARVAVPPSLDVAIGYGKHASKLCRDK
ncbi:hypothetical protein ACAF76_004615 [Brevibacillus sp. TJ4]|uniref:hypothetical protein n=1 Tax=Brevibacillus sp. TJ4 TaxID=3234853 RepID=UPI0037CF498C